MTRQRWPGWLLACLLFFPTTGAWAQGEAGQAALVIVLGDGQVETRCISLEEGPLTGAEMLQHSDLEVVFEVSALGQKVCQVQGVGCPYPSRPCFCQCMSSDCTYWNYYYREPGAATWTYSPLGSGARQIQPGGMEGWVWGDGRTPPPSLAFEAICLPPATSEPTAPPTEAEPTSTPPPCCDRTPIPHAGGTRQPYAAADGPGSPSRGRQPRAALYHAASHPRTRHG